MRLGIATVGELDTASIATACRIWPYRYTCLYCLRLEIKAQLTTLRSFVKRLVNLESQKSQSLIRTDKARPEESGSEPPAKKKRLKAPHYRVSLRIGCQRG